MDEQERERLARLTLSRVFEPGDHRAIGGVRDLGAEEYLHRLRAGRDPAAGLHDEIAARLAVADPAQDLLDGSRLGARFVVPGDREWPRQLDDLMGDATLLERGGPPFGLWVHGPLRLDELERSVAVVGSRSATTYGTDVAGAIAASTARAGFTVVSGAAFGIDQAAHRGALGAGGRTVAVLACGIDRVYPQAHKHLVDHLRTTCAVVSEAAPGTSPMRLRFLSRNRLIAALSQGTVVVEAAVRSGALNTSTWAERLNRLVMGVPGPVTSAPSQGVHELIRNGAATLVATGEHVLEMLGSSGEHLLEVPRSRPRARDGLRRHDQQVLDAVPVARGARVDSIARTAGLGLHDVAGTLERLRRDGFVQHGEEGWHLTARAHT